jgi:hypothetical protein
MRSWARTREGTEVRYQVVMQYPDGTEERDDEVFDTEAEAKEYGLTMVSNYAAGGEVLHLSNPGDYPEDGGGDADFEVEEIDD